MFTLPKVIEEDRDAFVKCGTKKVMCSNLKKEIIDGVEYYVVSIPFAAKVISRATSLEIYDGSNEKVKLVTSTGRKITKIF